MTTANPQNSIEIPLALLAQLAVERWRVDHALQGMGNLPGAARHGLRRMEEFLKQAGVETVSMDGRLFDPGLPLKVIDCTEDPALPSGQTVVSETISPLIVYRGQVIRDAEVITRRGPS